MLQIHVSFPIYFEWWAVPTLMKRAPLFMVPSFSSNETNNNVKWSPINFVYHKYFEILALVFVLPPELNTIFLVQRLINIRFIGIIVGKSQIITQ